MASGGGQAKRRVAVREGSISELDDGARDGFSVACLFAFERGANRCTKVCGELSSDERRGLADTGPRVVVCDDHLAFRDDLQDFATSEHSLERCVDGRGSDVRSLHGRQVLDWFVHREKRISFGLWSGRLVSLDSRVGVLLRAASLLRSGVYKSVFEPVWLARRGKI